MGEKKDQDSRLRTKKRRISNGYAHHVFRDDVFEELGDQLRLVVVQEEGCLQNVTVGVQLHVGGQADNLRWMAHEDRV